MVGGGGGGGGGGVKSFSCQTQLGYVRLSCGWVGVLTILIELRVGLTNKLGLSIA